MSLTVGFPEPRPLVPDEWRSALPGMETVTGLGTGPVLDALRRGDVDVVVLPWRAWAATEPGSGVEEGATPNRGEPRDLLLPAEGAPTLASLPEGGRVALSGARRRGLLAAHRPDLQVVELPDDPERTVRPFLRGGGAHAAILPAHLARRAGLSDLASEVLEPKAWLPSPAQGASALVIRSGDDGTRRRLEPLDHPPSRAALEAELALAEALDLGPGEALGALALPYGRWLRLWAMVPSPDGRRLVRADRSGSDRTPEVLAREVASELRARGLHRVVPATAARDVS